MRKFLSLFAVLLVCGLSAFSQTRLVTGKVTDQNGQPVPFASVILKGDKTGTSADANGAFSISAKSGDILVSRSNSALTEVVVTALGIQRQAKDLGYATATLNNRTLTQAKSVNIAQALNGKVSGLNISTVNSGVFENAKINIRGIRSLTGNNQPMLVVDGAPTPLGYLSSIPPDDVQDLTVLKSAASAAIYGPDAVNGVIVITTKRGGKTPTVTITSTWQATKVSFFPKIQ